MPRPPKPRWALVLFALALLGAHPSGAAAASLSVSAEEEAALRAREVVVRPLPSSSSSGVRVLAVVDIHASRAAVWAALLDFQARITSSSAARSAEHYRPPTATEQWVRWRVSKFGFEIGFHNHYLLDVANGRLVHELDATQENDLAGSRGVYDLHPSPAGADWTRLAYEVESKFGQALPEFVQRWMSTGATRDFMTNMATNAEAKKP